MQLHVAAWSAWAPGLETPEAWRQWAASSAGDSGGGIAMLTASPPLAHLDSMFKRRLSQLSRMILHVGHELAPARQVDTVFASHYGEISQQYKISQNLIEEGEVKPAAFSLSVFNTPVALLSIAEKNERRGSALYGGEASFTAALLEALALVARHGEEVLLLAGDESLPEAWQALAARPVPPHALGLLISPQPVAGGTTLGVRTSGNQAAEPAAGSLPQPLRFLAWFLGGCPGSLELSHRGFRLSLVGAG